MNVIIIGFFFGLFNVVELQFEFKVLLFDTFCFHADCEWKWHYGPDLNGQSFVDRYFFAPVLRQYLVILVDFDLTVAIRFLCHPDAFLFLMHVLPLILHEFGLIVYRQLFVVGVNDILR